MGLVVKPIVKKMDFDYMNDGNIKRHFTRMLVDRQGGTAVRARRGREDRCRESGGDTIMRHDMPTEMVCSQMISFDLNDNVVSNIVFTGGCNGNLKAISKLVDGWTVEKIEEYLKGNTCGPRPTSCADQLARAVRKAYEEEKKGA